jgi:hypothetical protein
LRHPFLTTLTQRDITDYAVQHARTDLTTVQEGNYTDTAVVAHIPPTPSADIALQTIVPPQCSSALKLLSIFCLAFGVLTGALFPSPPDLDQ